MRAIDAEFSILDAAIPSPAYLLNSVRGDGLTRVAGMTSRMRNVRTFFVERTRDEATRFADRMIAAIEDLRAELARAEPDQAAAIDALDGVKTACAACHAAYREGSKETGFRFKRGTVER